MLISIVAVKNATSRSKEGLLGVALGMFIPIIFASLLRLPLILFIPLMLACFLVAVRFNDYPQRARFAVDWALGSMLLIVTSSLEATLALQVTVPSVLLFFALGIASMILWNAIALESAGLQPDYGGLGRSILLFILGVGGISLVLGMLLSPSFLHSFVDLAQRVYLVIADGVMLLIVRPFVWLLTPLFRWVENLELQEGRLELPGSGMVEDETLQRSGSPLSSEAMEAVTWISWAIFISIIALVVWMIIRRLLRRPMEEKGRLVQETRESVFSRSEVLGDLRNALKGLFKPLAKLGQAKWYKGDDPVLRIRTLYAQFAVKARKRVPMPADMTPNEFAQILMEAGEELDEEALSTLTKLYNDARYGEAGDQGAVTRAERALRDVW